LRQQIAAFLVKGGVIRQLKIQPSPMLDVGRVKVNPDWGYTRKNRPGSDKRGRPSHERFDVACQECHRDARATGKDYDHAVGKLWRKGWYITKDEVFCPRHKPGSNFGFDAGDRVHNRNDGNVYKVVEFRGKGDNPVNFGGFPELVVEDASGREMVFVFWDGRIPDNLARVG